MHVCGAPDKDHWTLRGGVMARHDCRNGLVLNTDLAFLISNPLVLIEQKEPLPP